LLVPKVQFLFLPSWSVRVAAAVSRNHCTDRGVPVSIMHLIRHLAPSAVPNPTFSTRHLAGTWRVTATSRLADAPYAYVYERRGEEYSMEFFAHVGNEKLQRARSGSGGGGRRSGADGQVTGSCRARSPPIIRLVDWEESSNRSVASGQPAAHRCVPTPTIQGRWVAPRQKR
jgi:hypothetical protein